ncbi:MAG: DUF3256 family protein [Prevotella sp.]|nr:DUF3256 family protein [Prevotella sp.]
MSKIILSMLFCMLSPIYISAQSVSETFVNMPDTILPYLAIQQRKDLVELKRMEPDSTAIINSGLGKIELTRLTDSIISLCLSEHNSFELGIISPDTLYIIKTYGAPLQESVCTLYSGTWQKLRTFDFADTVFEDFEDTCEFSLVSATIGSSPSELILQLNVPLLTQEDKEKTNGKTMQKYTKWNGKMFN